MEQFGGLQHRHGEQPLPGGAFGPGERFEEGDAGLLGELRQYESGQQRRGAAEPVHEVGDLGGGADPDEEQRQPVAGTGGEFGELPDEVGLTGGDVPVVDRVLQAQHHGHHPEAGLLADVVGEVRAGGRAVEGGSEGDGEDAGGRVRGELLGFPVEEFTSEIRREVFEMSHDAPFQHKSPVDIWPIIVRTAVA